MFCFLTLQLIYTWCGRIGIWSCKIFLSSLYKNTCTQLCVLCMQKFKTISHLIFHQNSCKSCVSVVQGLCSSFSFLQSPIAVQILRACNSISFFTGCPVIFSFERICQMGLAPKLLQSVPKMLNILCTAPVNGLSYTILMLKGIIRSTTAQEKKNHKSNNFNKTSNFQINVRPEKEQWP